MILEKVLNELNYNPTTGIFTWVRNGRGRSGDVGNKTDNGYIRVCLNGKKYMAHRLAWLIYYKQQPVGEIDHINGIRNDNRIENLRDVNRRENSNNKASHRSGKLFGSTYIEKRKKWKSSINIDGKNIFLGYYNTEKEAHEVYLKTKSQL